MTIRDRLGITRINDDGSALPLALLVLLVLTVLGMAMVAIATTNFSIASSWKSYNDAFYAADAGLESGIVNLRSLLAAKPNPAPADLALLTAPALATSRASFAQYSVSALNAVPYRTTFRTGAYTGLFGNVTDYTIAAQTNGTDGSTANLTQLFKYVRVPLFQFGVFYGKGVDLEIAPGPPMTIHGRVHANSNIYMGAGSTLQFDSAITTAGTVNRGIKRDPSAIPFGNDPQILDANGMYQSLNFDHTYQQGFTSTWSSPQQWASAAYSRFGNNLQDQAMGVGQIVPPGDSALFDPNTPNPDVLAHQLIEMANPSDPPSVQNAKLYNQAGVRIIDGVARDAQGNTLSVPGLIQTKTFYDAREGRVMSVTEVDVSVLRSSGVAPSNGIVYVGHSGTYPSPGLGVRLVNGSQLPSQGLTVVSQDSVYVQGDYNTVNKVPAAVMGDAITVLSNNWAANGSDAKGNQTSDRRPAVTTTVNAAFATGPSAESTSGSGNGQLENSIRFLEDWNSQTINYSGSLIELWHSREATGAWRSPGTALPAYYTAPNRNWAYDTLFNTSQPPGTPSGVVMIKSTWARK